MKNLTNCNIFLAIVKMIQYVLCYVSSESMKSGRMKFEIKFNLIITVFKHTYILLHVYPCSLIHLAISNKYNYRKT